MIIQNLLTIIHILQCGTGGLTGALVGSFSCKGKEHEGTSLRFKGCLNDNSVIRSHDATGGLKLIQKVREEDGYGNDAQCIIITATRHPRPWTASLFVESRQNELCDGNFSYEWLEKEYHDFIMGGHVGMALVEQDQSFLRHLALQ